MTDFIKKVSEELLNNAHSINIVLSKEKEGKKEEGNKKEVKSSEKQNYEKYEESLSVILEHASKEYWSECLNINSHQIMVGRTYLWVSAALLGTYFTIYSLISNSLSASLSSFFIFTSLTAITLVAAAFGICLYALPGRNGYLKVTDSWLTPYKAAYDLLIRESSGVYINTLSYLIKSYDTAIKHGNKTNAIRAKMLRYTSWLLVSSFVAAVFSGLIYLVEVFNH